MYFEGEKWATKLWKEFEAGRMSLRDAAWIIENGHIARWKIWDAWYKEFAHSDNVGRRLIEKKWASELTTNGVLDIKKSQMIAEYYDVGNVKDKLRADFSGTVAKMEKVEAAKASLTGTKLELFNRLRGQKAADIAKLEEMATRLQTLDDALLQWKNLEELAAKLVKNPDAWKDAASLETAVKKINAGKLSTVVDALHATEWKEAGKNLTGNKLKLFDKTAQEIEAMRLEAESLLKAKDKASKTVIKEMAKLQEFTGKVTTFTAAEAWEILKIIGTPNSARLSLRSIVYMSEHAKDLGKILQEVRVYGQWWPITWEVMTKILNGLNEWVLLKEMNSSGKMALIVGELEVFAKATAKLKVLTGIETLVKIIKTIR